ncbi:MAG: peptidase prolyl oligopeptidase active site domain protein [Gemmatimonadetes bacterium]|nr:peptidase prolyl oligopeptidase active site domain protein [Gemmatimonadota bacterium]
MRPSLQIALLTCPLALAMPATAQQAARPASAAISAADILDVVTYSIADLTDDGRFLATMATVRRDTYGTDFRHDGDPTYLRVAPTRVAIIDTKSGASTDIFKDRKAVRGLRWSPDGRRLAMLVFTGDILEPTIWDRTSSKLTVVKTPAGKYVAENSDIRWDRDGRQIIVALHSADWRKKARDVFAGMTTGPVFVQSSKDPFLAWDEIRRQGNVRSVVSIDVTTGAVRERIPEANIASFTLAEDGSATSYARDIAKKTDYDSFQSETSLNTRDSAGVDRVLRASAKGMQFAWAEDGKHYAYSNGGRVYLASIADTSSKLIAGVEPRKGETPDTSKAGRDKAALERFSVLRYSPANDAVLVSNKEGLWIADVATGAKEKIIAASDSDETLPRVAAQAWSQDGKRLYLTSASRTTWERGILRYDRDTKQVKELVKDNRSYSNLRLSKDGNTIVVAVAQGNRPADLYAGTADLSDLHRLVSSNPQLADKGIGPTELISYLDADGKPRKAVVYYPAAYQKGKTYPTVFEVYEDFFDDTFDVRANVLTGHGYVVVHPSVGFDIGYPGEAWLKGVTSAANKMIELGIADSARLAVQGQSYGGYATNLLITQTNRFKAAVNISGKVDMISFYTDSPRLGVRNVNAAEKTQDRLGATLWAQPQKYVAHSAIMFADRITTPLMLITGGLDSNVPADNTREMYYALRRLGKECVWVNYMNGGHGGGTASVEDFLDMHKRVLEWYDARLKPPAKPKVATNE